MNLPKIADISWDSNYIERIDPNQFQEIHAQGHSFLQCSSPSKHRDTPRQKWWHENHGCKGQKSISTNLETIEIEQKKTYVQLSTRVRFHSLLLGWHHLTSPDIFWGVKRNAAFIPPQKKQKFMAHHDKLNRTPNKNKTPRQTVRGSMRA